MSKYFLHKILDTYDTASPINIFHFILIIKLCDCKNIKRQLLSSRISITFIIVVFAQIRKLLY